jgi:hypothetical protein
MDLKVLISVPSIVVLSLQYNVMYHYILPQV